MRDKHVPHDEFVERLELEIGREVRRRNIQPTSSGWMPQWSLKSAAALVTLVLISMAAGGAVVAAAYQAQDNNRRDALTASYEAQLVLERDRLRLAQDQFQNAQQRMSMGLANEEAVNDARVKVIGAESTVRVIQLQLEEIKISKQEPQSDVTSPLVSGRDFVSERWKIEMEVPRTALEAEQKRFAAAQRRVEIGVADSADASASRARIIEIEAGIQTFQRKLDIRQRFLKGEYDAGMADLRVQEAVAEQKQKAIAPRIELAQKNADRFARRVELGTAGPFEATQARLDLMQLRMELAQADNELALVRQKIAQRGGK